MDSLKKIKVFVLYHFLLSIFQRFLIWQLPREEAALPTDSFSPWTKPFSKQDLEEVLKKQYKTVYTRDYLGIQPGEHCASFLLLKHVMKYT